MASGKVGPEEKRELILGAAATIFSQKGFQYTKIDDVAREAKIAKGSVYQYFDSKETLFFEVGNWVLSQILQDLRELSEQGFQEFLEKMLDLMADDSFFLLMMEFWAYGNHDTMKELFRDLYNEMRHILAQLVKKEQAEGAIPTTYDPQVISSGIIALCDGYFVQNQFCKDVDIRVHAKTFLRILFANPKE